MIKEILAKQIYEGEILVTKSNRGEDNDDYDSFIAMLDGVRTEKNFDWQSDIHLPELESHLFTQTSLDVGQYFSTRDFVEVYLEDEKGVPFAEAAKECINRTLNRRDLYHYAKFVRAKEIVNLVGRVYIRCWWEKESHIGVTGARRGEFGIETVKGEIVTKDQFNYDVWDQRNVFVDNSFCYSLQDKKWITFRTAVTKSELEEKGEYFNLDLLDDSPPKPESERETIDKEQNFTQVTSSIEQKHDVYTRYGKFWTICEEDENGPIEGTEKIGIDENGDPLKKAKLQHVVITIVADKEPVLIGFKLTPYIDALGRPFMPVIRGLCYIHPVYDGGMGDGKYIRELQIGIDDTFNLSQDRAMLAGIPTFKVKKTSIDDNSTLYFAPGHPMEVNDTKDIEEFRISDNIGAAMNQISVLKGMMQQVDAIQPPSMGNMPANASTTATAVATASQGTTTRNQYKSLTFEYTCLTELYWMILQMTWRFASPETGMKLMGDKIYDFDPTKNYYYKPLSQSIENDQSKSVKIKNYIQMLGYVSQIQHPDTVKIVNGILEKVAKLMGDEYSSFADKYLSEKIPIQGAKQGENMAMGGSNQAGMQMSTPEMATREGANAYG